MFARYLIASLGVSAWLGSLYWPSSSPENVTFLAVGQGDCILVQSGSSAWLVDTGPGNEGWDAGKLIVVPELRRRGIRSLEGIFVTHSDSDHTGGLRSVMEAIPPRTVYVPKAFASDPVLESVSDVQLLSGTQRMILGEWECLLWTPPYQGDDNAASLVMRLTTKDDSVLLTADQGFWGEEMMPVEFLAPVTVLKAGHHGSDDSMSDKFLKQLKPERIVFSCGRGNRFGHPGTTALIRAEGVAPAWRTDRDGPFTWSPGE